MLQLVLALAKINGSKKKPSWSLKFLRVDIIAKRVAKEGRKQGERRAAEVHSNGGRRRLQIKRRWEIHLANAGTKLRQQLRDLYGARI